MIPVPQDLVEQGLNRLPSQFQGKPIVEGVLKSYLEQLELAQLDIFAILNGRGISTAIGAQLDLIGKIVGEARKGRTDEPYRQALYLRIFINNSEGTPNDLIQLLKISTQASATGYWEHYPASVHLLTNGTIDSSLPSSLKKAAPAGVGDIRVYHNPYNDGWIPCEIGIENFDLIDNNSNTFVTEDNDTLSTAFYSYAGAVEQATLAEILPADFILADGSDFAVTDNGISLYDFSVITDVAVETVEIEATLRTHEGKLLITNSDFSQGNMLIDYEGEVPAATAEGILLDVYI